MNAQLEICKLLKMEQLFKDFKDVFAWTYKDLKGIPPELAQHIIELDTTIPPAHQAKYKLNPKYVIATKQVIDKLLVAEFIQYVEESTWLSP
jgi:predicted transcriptional regulator